jgi:hypothetical protein
MTRVCPVPVDIPFSEADPLTTGTAREVLGPGQTLVAEIGILCYKFHELLPEIQTPSVLGDPFTNSFFLRPRSVQIETPRLFVK